MSDWYSQVNAKTQPVFNAIVSHDFITELISGELKPAVFQFYIEQDTLYLSVYKRLLATIGTWCDNSDDCQFFLASASGVLEVETALHQLYLPEQSEPLALSPTCELYTSYLAKMVYSQPLAVALAAILPCFTIYQAVGDYILQQKQVSNNPYQSWINTYAGEEFANSTAQAIDIVNRYANCADPATRAKMEQAFIQASKLEWMFWDSAYAQQQWPI